MEMKLYCFFCVPVEKKKIEFFNPPFYQKIEYFPTLQSIFTEKKQYRKLPPGQAVFTAN